jgi:hypothetical protein
MASYIITDMTEAEFVNARNAYLYSLWLEGVERDREEAAARAKANRETYPEVEFLSDDMLWRLLTAAHAAVKAVHEKWGKIDTDKAREIIADANTAYFIYRHEHDYRQALGC